MQAPRLSVVLPLGDDRGLATDSVRAWSRQSLPASHYEVVAVDDGRRPRRSKRARAALRPHDQLILRTGASEIELYQAGAAAARGEFLLFTESHAVPARETAEALLGRLDRTGAAAATLRSGHLPRRGLASLEQRLGEVARAERPADRWWAGVSLRGFALHRRLFAELGGFRTELDRFAETALAIELDRRGVRAAEAGEALVYHGDCTWPGELEPALLALGRGRRAYLDAGPPDVVEPYVGAPGPLNRAVVDAGLARALCAALVRSIVSSPGRTATAADLASLLRWAPVALAGSSGVASPLRLRARLTLLACMAAAGDAERRLARFRRAWRQVSTCGEMQHLARQPLPPPTPPRCRREFSTCVRDTDFVGFHSRERDEAGDFRWTEPAALWRLALAPGRYRGRLRLTLPPGRPQLRLYVNGRALRATVERDSGGTCVITLPLEGLRAAGEQHLVLLSAAFRPRDLGSKDGRTLGVAARSLEIAPAQG